MRIVVCGGRDYGDISAVRHALEVVHVKHRIELLIKGGELGADRLARDWANANDVPVLTVAAEWKKYRNAAGPMRNQRMLTEGMPDAVVAFPGGRWTSDVVAKASAVGLKIWKPIK